MNQHKKKYITTVLLSVLFLFAFVYNLWFSRLGLNPLDSPIVFDGGWRLLNGQLFITDYNAPNGYVPTIIQGIFFKIFGVNWLAYALHSSLMNGLFAIISFLLLKKLQLNVWLAFVFSLFTACIFYPPMGTPYMDQHAFFFVLLSLFWGVMLVKSKGKKFIVYSILLPPTAALAFLSKQNPSIWLVVFVALLPLFIEKEQRLKALKWFSISFIGTLLGMWLFMLLFNIQLTDFIEQYIDIPRAIGKQRFDLIKSDEIITLLFYKPYEVLQINSDLNRFIIIFAHVVSITTLILSKNKKLTKNYLLLIFLYHLSILSSSWFVALTNNQPNNGVPFGFISYALLAIILSLSAKEILHHFKLIKAGNISSLILPTFIMAYCIPILVNFHHDVNLTRQVHDFRGPHVIKESSFKLSFQTEKFLSYQVVYHYNDFKIYELVDFLKKQEGDFFLFGDLSILYGLSGKPSQSPYLWFHPGLTFHDQNTDKWGGEDIKLAHIISKKRIRFIIFESKERSTFMNLRFDEFPKFKKQAEARLKEIKYIGGFEVWELN